jgi:mycothiol synthase
MKAAVTDALTVPHDPDLPGLRFRGFRGSPDYPGMTAANQAARDAAGALEMVTIESMARVYEHLVNTDPARDILIVERDAVIVGYARIGWRDHVDGSRAFSSTCLVHPASRRLGIGRAMLAWAEGRLGAIAAALPGDRPGSFATWTWDADAGAAVLLEATGWTRSGRGYEMVRPTLDAIPALPLPAGLEVRATGRTPAERRRVWDAAVESFRDHRNEEEATESDWLAMDADQHRDPALWAIAFDGDQIAAGVEGRIDPAENEHHGRLQGYIDGVWTRPLYRRRGLARALLARVLELLRERGMTSAYLGVDGLNPNQAMDLYTSLGFEISTSASDWTKPLPGILPTPNATESTP